MDEPLSNLDAQLRARDAPRDPRAAAQARHHDGLRDARPDRGDVHGRPGRADARAAGSSRTATPVDLYERPATTFVARFIGTPPMNLLQLERGRGGAVIAGTDGPVVLPAGSRAACSACGPSTSQLAFETACRARCRQRRVPRRRFARRAARSAASRSRCACRAASGSSRGDATCVSLGAGRTALFRCRRTRGAVERTSRGNAASPDSPCPRRTR